MIDLAPAYLEIVRKILREIVPNAKVWAFGSRVTGTAKEFSDLDLAIDMGSPIPVATLCLLKDAFSESDLPIKVDIVDWQAISEEFIEAVKENRFDLYRFKLCDLCNSIDYGYTASSTSEDTGIRFLRITDIVQEHVDWSTVPYCCITPKDTEKYRLLNDDIVIARTGASTGACLHISNPPLAVFASYLVRLRINSTIADSRYIYYCLKSEGFNSFLQGVLGDKSAQPNASAYTMTQFEFYLPPLETQKEIAHILGTLDDKIELNRRMNKTLEEIAHAIFKHWFIDFEFPNAEGNPYKSSGGEMIDSELGLLPKGWRVVKLGTKVDIIKGVSYSSYELSESTTAMVTLKSFNRGGGYKSDGLKAYTGKFKPEQVLKTGDLVIACTDVTQNADVIGRPAIIRKSRDYETLVASLDIIKLLPKSEDVPLSYLYFMTNSEVFNHHMFSHSTGTTVLHLAKEAIPSFQYAQPSFEIMNVFGRIAHAVLDLINTNENENNILSDYRDNLLHMIF